MSQNNLDPSFQHPGRTQHREEHDFAYLTVGADEINSETFLKLEKDTIAAKSVDGFEFTGRKPEANLHKNDDDGRVILTFVYNFRKKIL